MATATVIQGEDRDINFGVKDADEAVYIDLTGVTEIAVRIAAAAGSYTEFTKTGSEVTITDAAKGKFMLSMFDGKSSLLKLGDRDLEVIIDWNTTNTVTAWSYVSTAITITVGTHIFKVGDTITVTGLVSTTNPANGSWVITGITSTTVSYTATSVPTGSATVSSASATGGRRRIVQATKQITVTKRLF